MRTTMLTMGKLFKTKHHADKIWTMFEIEEKKIWSSHWRREWC